MKFTGNYVFCRDSYRTTVESSEVKLVKVIIYTFGWLYIDTNEASRLSAVRLTHNPTGTPTRSASKFDADRRILRLMKQPGSWGVATILTPFNRRFIHRHSKRRGFSRWVFTP